MTSLFIVTMFLQMKKVSNNPMSGPQSSILRKAYVDDVVCILPFTYRSFFFFFKSYSKRRKMVHTLQKKGIKATKKNRGLLGQ